MLAGDLRPLRDDVHERDRVAAPEPESAASHSTIGVALVRVQTLWSPVRWTAGVLGRSFLDVVEVRLERHALLPASGWRTRTGSAGRRARRCTSRRRMPPPGGSRSTSRDQQAGDLEATSAARSSASGVSRTAAICRAAPGDGTGEERRRELVADRGAQQHDPRWRWQLHASSRYRMTPPPTSSRGPRGSGQAPGRAASARRRSAEQVGLGAEVGVQQRGIHLRPRGDRAHRGAVVAVLAELVDGRRDDAVARVRAARAAGRAAAAASERRKFGSRQP